MRFLSPPDDDAQRVDGKDEINENSIVYLREENGSHGMRGFRGLFMGDARFETEARLLREGADLHADFLKVGHHGSTYASSPTFLAAVHPQIAAINVGRYYDFGHPAPRTIAALQETRAAVYRTDRCGAITVSADLVSAMSPCRTAIIGRESFTAHQRSVRRSSARAHTGDFFGIRFPAVDGEKSDLICVSVRIPSFISEASRG
jgi:hypothetical protein